tara:strand:- start:676 stop:1434 length:759 start_codon:yes stop_codon:yes gene_type:complete
MKFKIFIIFFFILASCRTTSDLSINSISFSGNKFSNSGFALIYNQNLYDNKTITKKMHERDLLIFQKNLKKGTSVKISNPFNDKSLLAKVGSRTKYPSFNNSVISIRIAKELEIDLNEPFILINEVVENSSFVAKKAKTFDEEKKVANKAPVDSISINNLNENETITDNKKKNKRKFNYSIKIADFYYLETAKNMVKRIKSEILINEVTIQKISEKNFRVLVGPFSNINSLQSSYNSVQKLQFENLEILKND